VLRRKLAKDSPIRKVRHQIYYYRKGLSPKPTQINRLVFFLFSPAAEIDRCNNSHLMVLHSRREFGCGHWLCISPAHLRGGNALENAEDRECDAATLH